MKNLNLDGNNWNINNEDSFWNTWKHLIRNAQRSMRGYSPSFIEAPQYRIMRRISDVINYLVDKNQIVQNLVKPEFVLNEYLKLYEHTKNEMTKQNILRELSKILQMQNNNNTSVEIKNNIPATPVQIVFRDDE